MFASGAGLPDAAALATLLLDALGHLPPEWWPHVWAEAFAPALSRILPPGEHASALAAAATSGPRRGLLPLIAYALREAPLLEQWMAAGAPPPHEPATAPSSGIFARGNLGQAKVDGPMTAAEHQGGSNGAARPASEQVGSGVDPALG